jgi:hypothetical protein
VGAVATGDKIFNPVELKGVAGHVRVNVACNLTSFSLTSAIPSCKNVPVSEPPGTPSPAGMPPTKRLMAPIGRPARVIECFRSRWERDFLAPMFL